MRTITAFAAVDAHLTIFRAVAVALLAAFDTGHRTPQRWRDQPREARPYAPSQARKNPPGSGTLPRVEMPKRNAQRLQMVFRENCSLRFPEWTSEWPVLENGRHSSRPQTQHKPAFSARSGGFLGDFFCCAAKPCSFLRKPARQLGAHAPMRVPLVRLLAILLVSSGACGVFFLSRAAAVSGNYKALACGCAAG